MNDVFKLMDGAKQFSAIVGGWITPMLLLVILWSSSIGTSYSLAFSQDMLATIPPMPTDTYVGFLPLVMNPTVKTTEDGIYLGVFFNPQAEMGDALRSFEALTGKRHSIYHYYTYWGAGDFNYHKFLLDQIVGYGALPMITFMSVPGPGNPGCGSTELNLDSINRGDHDVYLHTFASQIAQYQSQFLLRWGHEMNLNQYSWSGYCNGRNLAATQKFVSAYRRIVDIFHAAGANNVKWIWSPNYDQWPPESWNNTENYYPGDSYVDWIGVVGYNFGESRSDSGYHWDTFDDIFRIFLEDAQVNHPAKPVMIADFASSEDDGGDKAAWITEAFAEMKAYPNLRAAVYFHYNPPEYSPPLLFRIDSSADSVAAYRNAIQDGHLLSTMPE